MIARTRHVLPLLAVAAVAGCGGSSSSGGDDPKPAAATSTPTSEAQTPFTAGPELAKLSDPSLGVLQQGDLDGTKVESAVEVGSVQQMTAYYQAHGQSQPGTAAQLKRLGFEKAGATSFSLQGQGAGGGLSVTTRYGTAKAAKRSVREDTTGDMTASKLTGVPGGTLTVERGGGYVARNSYVVRDSTVISIGYAVPQKLDGGFKPLVAATKAVVARAAN